MAPDFVVSIWERRCSKISSLHKCQLLENVEQKQAARLQHQSLSSTNLNRPAHTWPELWEPRASLHIQVPKENQLFTMKSQLTKHDEISLPAGSKLSNCQLNSAALLPPLQQLRPIASTVANLKNSRSKSLVDTSNTKAIPKRLLKIADIKKSNSLPIVSYF